MIISINGTPGSGKSTVAKKLSEKLGYPWYSVGNLKGEIAKSKNLTIDELNKLDEQQPFSDQEIDEYQKKLGAEQKNFVIDGRLSWYFIPHSFKIFLTADPVIAATRIWQSFQMGEREDEQNYQSLDEVLQSMQNRVASDTKRYLSQYNIDFQNQNVYDVIINTTNQNPSLIVQKILDELELRGYHIAT